MTPYATASQPVQDEHPEATHGVVIQLHDPSVVIDADHTLPESPREASMPARADLTRGERWKLRATALGFFGAAALVLGVYIGVPVALAARSLFENARLALVTAVVVIALTVAGLAVVLRGISSARGSAAERTLRPLDDFNPALVRRQRRRVAAVLATVAAVTGASFSLNARLDQPRRRANASAEPAGGASSPHERSPAELPNCEPATPTAIVLHNQSRSDARVYFLNFSRPATYGYAMAPGATIVQPVGEGDLVSLRDGDSQAVLISGRVEKRGLHWEFQDSPVTVAEPEATTCA